MESLLAVVAVAALVGVLLLLFGKPARPLGGRTGHRGGPDRSVGATLAPVRLPEPSTPAGAAGLSAILAEPARALVAVDYDGTLAPIVERPGEAIPHPEAVATLGRLAGAVGAVAVITGRPVSDVLDLGGMRAAAGLDRLVILGQYGLERYDAATGALPMPEPPAGVAFARQRLPGLLEIAGVPPEVAIEDKGSALVVHTRRLPDPAATLERLRAPLAALAEKAGLEAVPGRLVVELRPAGTDKGRALTELARSRDAGAVLFAGDDVGDLPAYDAVERLRADGVPGVTVCSDSAEVTALRERADIVVGGPGGVVALLAALTAAIGGG